MTVEHTPEAAGCALMTCATDGLTHRLSPNIVETALAAGASQLPTLCGHLLLPASLTSPPGPACSLCLAVTTKDSAKGRSSRHHRTS